MDKVLTLIFLLLACSCHITTAQDGGIQREVGTVYLGFNYAQPLGGFKEAYPDGNAVGGTFGLLVNPLKRPSLVEVGMQVSYLSQGVGKIGTNVMSYYETYKTSHSIIPVHLVARVKAQSNLPVTPYLDGLTGMTFFYTNTKLKEGAFDFLRENYEPIVLNKYRSAGISYGIGAGLTLNTRKANDMHVDLRVVYLQSALSRYVKKGNVEILQDGFPAYTHSFSETSMFMVQLNMVGILKQ